jgi:hypothetical protein
VLVVFDSFHSPPNTMLPPDVFAMLPKNWRLPPVPGASETGSRSAAP